MQADRNFRPDRDMGLDEKEIGRDHFRLNIRSGERDFARSLKVPALEFDVDRLALASAQRRNADHERAHLGEIRIAPSGWNKQEESTDCETGSFHESKLPRPRKPHLPYIGTYSTRQILCSLRKNPHIGSIRIRRGQHLTGWKPMPP